MMDFFKANPSALMDAFPTPPGSDQGDDVPDTRHGQMDFTMTKLPKRDADTVSQVSARSSRSSKSNLSVRSTGSKTGFSFLRSSSKAKKLYGLDKQSSSIM